MRDSSLREIVIVLSVILLMGFIAIPQYQMFRERIHDTQIREDFLSIISALEQYHLTNGHYLNCRGVSCTEKLGLKPIPKNIHLEISTKDNYFIAKAVPLHGNGVSYTWNSKIQHLQ